MNDEAEIHNRETQRMAFGTCIDCNNPRGKNLKELCTECNKLKELISIACTYVCGGKEEDCSSCKETENLINYLSMLYTITKKEFININEDEEIHDLFDRSEWPPRE